MREEHETEGVTRREVLLLLGTTPIVAAALQGGIAMAEESSGLAPAYRGDHHHKIDYGANAKGYIDAFFESIDWQEVNRRLEAAQKSAATA